MSGWRRHLGNETYVTPKGRAVTAAEIDALIDSVPDHPLHDLVIHDKLSECEAALGRRFLISGRWQEGDTVTCPCGREFVHICEESEGCSWAPVET